MVIIDWSSDYSWHQTYGGPVEQYFAAVGNPCPSGIVLICNTARFIKLFALMLFLFCTSQTLMYDSTCALLW